MTNQQNPTKKLTKKAKQLFIIENFVRYKGHIGKLCKELGINRCTYYDWLKSAKFKQEIANKMEEIYDTVEGMILTRMEEMDDRELMKFYAKTKMRHRGFIEKTEVEHSGNIPINIEIIQKKENDETED